MPLLLRLHDPSLDAAEVRCPHDGPTSVPVQPRLPPPHRLAKGGRPGTSPRTSGAGILVSRAPRPSALGVSVPHAGHFLGHLRHFLDL